MKSPAEITVERLKKVLSNDKAAHAPARLNEVLRSDIYYTLDNYMEVSDLIVNTEFDEDGACYITVNCRADRLKTFLMTEK